MENGARSRLRLRSTTCQFLNAARPSARCSLPALLGVYRHSRSLRIWAWSCRALRIMLHETSFDPKVSIYQSRCKYGIMSVSAIANVVMQYVLWARFCGLSVGPCTVVQNIFETFSNGEASNGLNIFPEMVGQRGLAEVHLSHASTTSSTRRSMTARLTKPPWLAYCSQTATAWTLVE